ncbi:DUF6074 family protein [Ochrobactrum teleogrylli]|uniref:DUF6074 family protein n=1 Tax=Ochrobactrum teleogrylli TaxID=2479765 RepID=UPI00384D48AD
MGEFQMVGEQLDLLNWKAPAIVHAFPLSARHGKVKAVAENLSRKHGKAADTYWRQTVSTLGGQMFRAGVARSEIEYQLRSFFDAVQLELNRMAFDNYRNNGGAA